MKLSRLEILYFYLDSNILSKAEFMEEIYNAPHQDLGLDEADYSDLAMLNPDSRFFENELKGEILAHIDPGKIKAFEIIDKLDNIIGQNQKVKPSLIELYHMYGMDDFEFLRDIGVGFGPHLIYMEDKGDNDIPLMYPAVKEIALELKRWLESGDIRISYTHGESPSFCIEDNRVGVDKISRVWRSVSSKNSVLMTEDNVLLDENGRFCGRSIYARK